MNTWILQAVCSIGYIFFLIVIILRSSNKFLRFFYFFISRNEERDTRDLAHWLSNKFFIVARDGKIKKSRFSFSPFLIKISHHSFQKYILRINHVRVTTNKRVTEKEEITRGSFNFQMFPNRTGALRIARKKANLKQFQDRVTRRDGRCQATRKLSPVIEYFFRAKSFRHARTWRVVNDHSF